MSQSLIEAIAIVQIVRDALRNASDVNDPLPPEQVATLQTALDVALGKAGEVLDAECAR